MTLAAAAMHRAAGRLPRFIPFAVALALITSGVQAGEPMYVIEQLVIGVNSAPAGAGDRVATLKSGERVEVLARQGEEAQIQLANGTSGWVKASYLSAELPLQRRLQDQTAELEKLKQELTRLQSQVRPAPAPPAAVADSAGSPGSPRPVGDSGGAPTNGTLAPGDSGSPQGTPVRDASPFMGGEGGDSRPPWLWVLACSAITLALGFFVGWRMLDRRIRRKYGGLRIY